MESSRTGSRERMTISPGRGWGGICKGTEMAPRGKVALFVCPSTPFFLDALGFCHGDLKDQRMLKLPHSCTHLTC